MKLLLDRWSVRYFDSHCKQANPTFDFNGETLFSWIFKLVQYIGHIVVTSQGREVIIDVQVNSIESGIIHN